MERPTHRALDAAQYIEEMEDYIDYLERKEDRIENSFESCRDKCAQAALAGLLTTERLNPKEAARMSYRYADAMIEERKRDADTASD